MPDFPIGLESANLTLSPLVDDVSLCRHGDCSLGAIDWNHAELFAHVHCGLTTGAAGTPLKRLSSD